MKPFSEPLTVDDIKRERDKFFASLMHHFSKTQMFDGSSQMDERFVYFMQAGHQACCCQLDSMRSFDGRWLDVEQLDRLVRDMQTIIDDPDQSAGIAMMWADRITLVIDAERKRV